MANKVLIVDDDPFNLDLLDQELIEEDYTIERASDGEEALQKVESFLPDVVLLDYMMPKMNGIEVLKQLRQDERFKTLPVILLTAKGSQEDKAKGLDAGADDYVVKPFETVELLARVRSMMRLKEMHDSLEEWNRTLSEKVAQQLDEIEHMNRLKRYLAPQIAETIIKSEDDSLFKSHRREITVVFLDLRGFTAFSDSAEPEEVMELLRSYHAEMGKLIFKYEGTLERFAGDGIMVFFNDPIPCAYATLGNIGFEGRMDYGAVGNVTNLAARLCGEAKGGQILTNQRTLSKIEDSVAVEPLEELLLKGFVRPVTAFNIVELKQRT